MRGRPAAAAGTADRHAVVDGGLARTRPCSPRPVRPFAACAAGRRQSGWRAVRDFPPADRNDDLAERSAMHFHGDTTRLCEKRRGPIGSHVSTGQPGRTRRPAGGRHTAGPGVGIGFGRPAARDLPPAPHGARPRGDRSDLASDSKRPGARTARVGATARSARRSRDRAAYGPGEQRR